VDASLPCAGHDPPNPMGSSRDGSMFRRYDPGAHAPVRPGLIRSRFQERDRAWCDPFWLWSGGMHRVGASRGHQATVGWGYSWRFRGAVKATSIGGRVIRRGAWRQRWRIPLYRSGVNCDRDAYAWKCVNRRAEYGNR
jgi:hypothetical protein